MIIADDSELVAIRKVVRKVLKVDRFSYSEEQGKFYLDPTGQLVFMNDVVKAIESMKP